MAKKSKRAKAAIKLKFQGPIGAFIIRVRGISLDIANNVAVFATPVPTVVGVNGHINDLQTSQDAVQTRLVGASTTRDLAYDVVWQDVYDWLAYVQGLADEAPDLAAAINIITLSGFDVRLNGMFIKPDLAVKEIAPGTVKLTAKAMGRRVSYEWQMSTTNGNIWINLPGTLITKLIVSGLLSGTRYLFRVRGLTKTGLTIYTSPVSIVIQYP
jgi:hypothetical protein